MFVRYFSGRAIDIGSGPDPLSRFAGFWPFLQSVDEWDVEDGDAQYLAGVSDASFDCVYSSHTLEHLVDPAIALDHWLRVLKPGGYLVFTVPDEDMYEQGVWPPRFNNDHKHTFTIAKASSWSPVSVNLADLLRRPDLELIKLERIVENFREDVPEVDQTSQWIAESCIEVVARKLPPEVGE